MTIKNSKNKTPLFQETFARRLLDSDNESFNIEDYIPRHGSSIVPSLYSLNEAFKEGTLSFDSYLTVLLDNADKKTYLKRTQSLILSDESSYVKFLHNVFDFVKIKDENFVFTNQILAEKLINCFSQEFHLNAKVKAVIEVLCYSEPTEDLTSLRQAFKPFIKILKQKEMLTELDKLSIKLSFKNK